MSPIRTLSKSLQRSVDRLLAGPTGVDATAAILTQLCAQLASLVGDSGISAILDRAWKEHRAALGAAAEVLGVVGWLERIQRIATQLRLLDAIAAHDVARAVVTSFVATVCTFIGESLTVRLMQDLWPDVTKDPT